MCKGVAKAMKGFRKQKYFWVFSNLLWKFPFDLSLSRNSFIPFSKYFKTHFTETHCSTQREQLPHNMKIGKSEQGETTSK